MPEAADMHNLAQRPRADRVSRGEKNVPPIKVNGNDEIATVASSFNRMQLSLAKALKMFEEG